MNRKSQKEIQVTTHMVRQFLQENEDTGYRDFHSNLLPGVDNVMGIRLPVLRKFAKQLSGMDWQEWFEQADDQWYEETMLRGLVSAYAKMECKERLTYVAKFVPDINNWAVCDCFCSTLKDADKYQAEYWDFIETYFTSNKEYEARFAAVMLLGHFVKREYLKESIRRLESITQQGYYAKMAVAWAVSVYFAAFPDEMLTYLQDGHKLDEFTYKKSLQKITESYRVDKEMKKGISKEEAIKELQNRETVFVAYSQATKLPYVKCDEETYNDQAWIFSTEEGIKEFGKKMLEEKVLLMGMKFTKKDYPRLYGTFYAIGVNTVVWVDGEDKIEIDLPDVAKQADMSKIEPAKRPLLNPTLELSGIYFMQELRRPVEKDQHGNLRELEEELIVNLKKSEYLVAMNVDPEDPKKINIPYLKNKKEEILQPVFTDVMELEKFTKGQKLRIAKVPFAKLPELLIDKAMAYAVNPLGFNLVLNREQLNKIIGLK